MSDKPIIYIIIGTGNKPLASYSQYTGEFIQTCEKHLTEVQPNKTCGINYNDYCIYYLNENNITYMIMTSTTYPKNAALSCLESLKKEFGTDLEGVNFSSTQPYGLSQRLEQKLKMKFDYYTEHSDIKSEALENLKLEIVKMDKEVDKARKELLERGEKTGQLVDKSNELKDASNSYRQGAIKVHKATKKRKIGIYLGIILSLLIIIYLIICMACKSWTFKCGSD